MCKTVAIKDIDTALRIYYQYTEIGIPQIMQLFNVGRSSAGKYKKAALEQQVEDGVKTMNLHTVNTETAYKTWGIDVDDLERRKIKLEKLGLKEKVS